VRFTEIGVEGFEQRGQINGVRQIQFRVEVDRPAAVARALVQQNAILVHLAHQLEPVNHPLARAASSSVLPRGPG